MTGTMFVAFLARAIKFATVFIFGSTGETITEKSGHLNMGIPGIMYLGALGGILGERIYLDSIGPETALNPFLVLFMPMLFAMLFAAVGGLLFSFFTVTLKCNHNVTGLTITTFGVGLSWACASITIDADNVFDIIHTDDYYKDGAVSHN